MFKEKNCDVKPIFLARGFTKENLIEIVNHFSSICAGEAYEVRPLIDVANKEGYLHKNLAMGVEIAIKTPGLANEYYLRKWG